MFKKSSFIALVAALAISVGAQGQQGPLQNGIKMYNYKKWQSAERILEPLAATDALANYYLGLCYLNEGNTAKASELFNKYPEDFANISGLARVAFATKDPAKGMQIAKDLAAKAKKKAWEPLKYAADAIAYSEGGDYQQAKVWYTEALAKADQPEMRIGLGDTYRRIPGGGGDAMNNYEHITEKDATNSLAFSRIGDLWYDARNYPSALDNYAKAKNADATNPLPYRALADAYSRSGKHQLALQNIQEYIKLSDNTLSDRMVYLRSLYLAQSFCDAVKQAQDLYNTPQLPQENKVEALGVLGYSQAQCGDSLEAINNLRRYFQVQDSKKILPGDYIQLGKLFMKLGQLDSAGVYYTLGISGDTAKNKSDIYREIAEGFKAKKDYCKSADWYNNLIVANPDAQPADYAWRGIMYWYCKDYTKAAKTMDEYATKYPDQPSAFFWQGRVAATVDSEATTGAGEGFFLKWLEKIGPTYEKKNELKTAYLYLMYYYYNKKDYDNLKVYMEKIRTIDPNDRNLKEIDEAIKAAGTPRRAAPAGK